METTKEKLRDLEDALTNSNLCNQSSRAEERENRAKVIYMADFPEITACLVFIWRQTNEQLVSTEGGKC